MIRLVLGASMAAALASPPAAALASVPAGQIRPLVAHATPVPLGDVAVPGLGPGFTVTGQGPLQRGQFASDAPDPTAISGALGALRSSGSTNTYERSWQADDGLDRVQDLVVRFPSENDAQAFLRAAERSFDSGKIVSKGILASVPGARLVTYLAATDGPGVGEAVAMRSGAYVALLTFVSSATGRAQPIAPTTTERMARAQHLAIVSAGTPRAAGSAAKKSATTSEVGWAVLAVLVVALAVATPVLVRRRHGRHRSHAA